MKASGARRTLEAYVEPALEELGRILEAKDTPPHVRLAAIRDILDRTGHKSAEMAEISVNDAVQVVRDEVARMREQREA